MTERKIIPWNELGGASKERFNTHARVLIDSEYVSDLTLDELAEKIYNAHISQLIDNIETARLEKPRSFMDHDKSIKEDVEKKINPTDGNAWLK